jgi:hypothetical protein
MDQLRQRRNACGVRTYSVVEVSCVAGSFWCCAKFEERLERQYLLNK